MLETIRPAALAEAGTLTALAQAGKRHWGYSEAWMEIWRKSLSFTPDYVTAHLVFCAEDETGQVIGFYALERDNGQLRLEHLWLVPQRIGCGLGRQLFEHAARTAATQGATELFIEADPNAEGFYLRMGAQRIGETVSRLTGTERIVPELRYAL